MRNKLASINRRDVLAAVVVVALGIFGVVEALGYRLGELRNIGPGTFPLIVSVLILISGLLIGAESVAPGKVDDDETDIDPPRYRVLIFVSAGLLSFAVVTPMFGALPGIFACVFLSSAADGRLSFWQVAILASVVAGFCSLLFVNLLNLPLELWEW